MNFPPDMEKGAQAALVCGHQLGRLKAVAKRSTVYVELATNMLSFDIELNKQPCNSINRDLI